jgi:hypothetical protein
MGSVSIWAKMSLGPRLEIFNKCVYKIKTSWLKWFVECYMAHLVAKWGFPCVMTIFPAPQSPLMQNWPGDLDSLKSVT